jgi:hypothetical protein
MAHPTREANLGAETPNELRRLAALAQDLYSNGLTEVAIVGLVHETHSALPQGLDDLVPASED